MKKYDTTVIAIKTMLLLFAALISGCAAKPLGVDDSPLDIGKIRIDAIDKRANISVETISRCS